MPGSASPSNEENEQSQPGRKGTDRALLYGCGGGLLAVVALPDLFEQAGQLLAAWLKRAATTALVKAVDNG